MVFFCMRRIFFLKIRKLCLSQTDSELRSWQAGCVREEFSLSYSTLDSLELVHQFKAPGAASHKS